MTAKQGNLQSRRQACTPNEPNTILDHDIALDRDPGSHTKDSEDEEANG